MEESAISLEKSFYCDQLAADLKYGFISALLMDTSVVDDQEWYFEIKDFKAHNK